MMQTLRQSWMSGAAFALAAALSAGCNMENWDWFGMNRQEETPATRRVGKARRPVNQPVAAAEPAEKPDNDDADAREVNEKVDRYVASMDQRYDPTYQRNDFQSKISRQNDPDRPARIRQTAARSQAAFPSEVPADEQAPAVSTPGDSADMPGDSVDESRGDPTAPSIRDESRGDSDSFGNSALEPETTILEPATNDISAETEGDANVGTRSEPIGSEVESPPPPEQSPDLDDTDMQDHSSLDESEMSDPPLQPPVLEEIRITESPLDPEDSRITTNDNPTPPGPKGDVPDKARDRSSEVVDTLGARVQELQSIIAADPEDLEAQLRLRMLYLVEGDDDKALAASPGVSDEINEIIRRQIEALLAARSDAGRDPAMWATRQLAAVEELRDLLKERADLQIPRMVFCSKVSGFGAFEPIERPEYVAGRKNQILIYVEIDNFTSEKTEDGMYRTLLSVRQSLLTESGEELWSHKDENIEDLTRRRRRDFYLTTPPRTLPKNLAPGTYIVKIEIEDVLAQKMNSETLELKIIP